MKATPIALLAAAATLTLPCLVAGHSGGPEQLSPRCEVIELRGEFIDPMCYFVHDARGMSHAKCAELCAKGGQNLAFLDDDSGRVYPLIARGHGENPNTMLMPYIGHAVRVKLAVYRKNVSLYAQVMQISDQH